MPAARTSRVTIHLSQPPERLVVGGFFEELTAPFFDGSAGVLATAFIVSLGLGLVSSFSGRPNSSLGNVFLRESRESGEICSVSDVLESILKIVAKGRKPNLKRRLRAKIKMR